MPTIEKSALLPYAPRDVFALVDAVEHYPEFLPWCRAARVSQRDDDTTCATLDIDYRGIRQSFTTENTRSGHGSMTMRLVEGPFRRLDGRWTFTALGDAGCRVALSLDFEVASGPLGNLLTPVLSHIAETLFDRFVARAESHCARLA
ncbi:MAG: type II toxin-antitoxin system RatA family toxin [Betaproteobacteria bacterium]|nr:type II toxin-antitoxin system RatA family toxin [Betaproteobacteria bacterium]